MTWWCDICLSGNPDGIRSCGRCGTPARGPQPAPVSPVTGDPVAGDPVAAARVAGARVAGAQEIGDSPARHVRLIGRQVEQAAIEGILQALVRDGRGGLISILGAPGAGKSHLLKAAEAATSGRIAWYRARGLPYAAMWPYGPAGDLAAQLPGTPVNNPFVARLLDLPAGDLIGSIDAEAFRAGLHRAVNRWLVSVSDERPVVVAVEDIQWADWATLTLLGELASLPSAHPIVLAVTSRAEGRFRIGRLVDAFDSVPQCNLTLSGLDRAATGELLRALMDPEPPARFVETVAERSGGNPLFIEQAGRVGGESGESGIGADLPDSLDALISARIDHLSPSTARVLATASVIGHVFGPGALSAIGAGDVADVDADNMDTDSVDTDSVDTDSVDTDSVDTDTAIDQLVAGGFLDTTIRGGRPALMFHHATIEEAAYTRLTPAQRRELHRRALVAARHLFGPGGDHADLVAADRMARHADLGESGPAAVDCLAAAAGRARRLLVTDRAIAHLRRAIDILSNNPASDHPSAANRVPALQLEVAGLEHDRGRHEEAIALYEGVLNHGAAAGDQVEARRGLAATLRAKGDGRRALKVLDHAICGHERDPAQASLWLERGRALDQAGRSAEALAAFGQGLMAAGGPDRESPVVAGLLLELCRAEAEAADPAAALEHGLAAADVLERLGDLRGVASVLMIVTGLYRELGRREEAAAAGRRATALAERTGLIEEGAVGADPPPIEKTAC
jgi:tetratricopeptide (TPR) repeat protein